MDDGCTDLGLCGVSPGVLPPRLPATLPRGFREDVQKNGEVALMLWMRTEDGWSPGLSENKHTHKFEASLSAKMPAVRQVTNLAWKYARSRNVSGAKQIVEPG